MPSAGPPGPRGAGGAPVLQVSGVTKRFGPKMVLSAVQLSVRPGEVACVMGRSGAGKSTLVHVLAGLDSADAGAVRIGSADLARMDAEGRAAFRLRHVGVVFQHFNLIPDLTALENVALPMQLRGVRRRERHTRGRELLARFGVEGLADRFPDVLSGGELQRLAVARALANRPDVVLADEPTANLDEENAAGVADALRTAAGAGAAVLVASHDALLGRAADRRYRLEAGRLTPAA